MRNGLEGFIEVSLLGCVVLTCLMMVTPLV